MSDQGTITALILLLCVGLSFLFSGMESGVLALNRFRVRQLVRAGDPRAKVLHRFLANPEDFLWTILVGNTVANFVIFSLGLVELHDHLAGHAVWLALAFLAAVFVFYIVCELLPKTLFQRFPNKLTLVLARSFQAIHFVLRPAVRVAAWISRGLLRLTGGQTYTGRLFGNREELRFLTEVSTQELTSEEKAMINRVLDLPDLRVRQVTVPMARTVTVKTNTPVGEALALCREKNLTRLPVIHPGTKRVMGIFNSERLIYSADLDLTRASGDNAQPAFFLGEDVRLEEALRRMQHSGRRIAIVLGRDQVEIGIISLQDILKVIFGGATL